MLMARRSSECWDTPKEFIVLAQQSRASGKLETICSGIKRLGTMALNTCVRRVPRANHDGEEEIQMLMGTDSMNHAPERAKKEVEYGKIVCLNRGPSIAQGICRLIKDCLGTRRPKNVRL